MCVIPFCMSFLGFGPPLRRLNFTPESLVETLVSIISEEGACFIFGAFVIEDPDHAVFTQLLESAYKRWTYSIFPTHDVFLTGARARNGYYTRSPSDENGKTVKALRGQWEVPIKDFSPCLKACENQVCKTSVGETKQRVILMYPFETIKITTGEKKRYTFMKLEDRAFYNPLHLVDAIKRYQFGQAHTSDFFDSRREDDVPSSNRYKIDQKLRWANSAEAIFYDDNVRASNEMFVPWHAFGEKLQAVPKPRDCEAGHGRVACV